ncbi:hypothetical protein V8E51_018548 [Hyaloscypha variabilis]
MKKMFRMEKAAGPLPEILHSCYILNDQEYFSPHPFHIPHNPTYSERISIPTCKADIPFFQTPGSRLHTDDQQAILPRKPTHLKRRGTCFGLSFTKSPVGAGIQPGPILDLSFPDSEKDPFRQQWAAEASLTMGEDNFNISSIQVNFSRLDEAMENGIKGKAHIHIDKNDDPKRLSLVLFLSKFPKDVFPGRFNITSAGLTCSAETFGALVFTGKHPHCGSGVGRYPDDLSPDSNLRATLPEGLEYPELEEEDYPDMRISAIIYPRRDCMRQGTTRLRKLTEEAALGAFITRRGQREFENVEELQQMFSWEDDDGIVAYPRSWLIDLAQQYRGKTIQELEDRHEASLYISFGDRIPRQEEALAAGKVQCPHYYARYRELCRRFFHPSEGVGGYKKHNSELLNQPASSRNEATRAVSRKRKRRISWEESDADGEDELFLDGDFTEEEEEASGKESGAGKTELRRTTRVIPGHGTASATKYLEFDNEEQNSEEEVDFSRTTPIASSNSTAVVIMPSNSASSSDSRSAPKISKPEPNPNVVQIPSKLLLFLMDSIDALRNDVARLREENARLLSEQKE